MLIRRWLRQITSVDKQIKPLQELQKRLKKQRDDILRQIKAKDGINASGTLSTNGTLSIDISRAAASSSSGSSLTDYMPATRNRGFQWSKEVNSMKRSVWGIRNFRFCQEGVINASLDGREYVLGCCNS